MKKIFLSYGNVKKKYILVSKFFIYFFIVSLMMVLPTYATVKLENQLKQEEKKAKQRRASLNMLTMQERKINLDLAAAEKRIFEIEKKLQQLHIRLEKLAASYTEAEKDYSIVREEQEKTFKARSDLMKLLWELSCQRMSLGNRQMTDWHVTDREYHWSKDLLKILEKYQYDLGKQQKQLEKIVTRRENISREIESALHAMNRQKEQLLRNRVSYSQNLDAIRKKKIDTEAELQALLELIESLNFRIEEMGGHIEKRKGSLPWPVKGIVKKHFNPSAEPPSRGIGIAASEGQVVRSIAAGQVVHNDVLRGFGTVLIIQHGSEYYSLYAFLGSSPLKLGRQVRGGEKIGTVGFYPDIHGAGIYFELRFRQKAINPEQWLSTS